MAVCKTPPDDPARARPPGAEHRRDRRPGPRRHETGDPVVAKPRRFSLHWGEGIVEEEARVEGQHHDPSLQLLAFDDGAVAVRFCYYNKQGRFQRSPLILGPDEIALLKAEIRHRPKLRRLLKSLVD